MKSYPLVVAASLLLSLGVVAGCNRKSVNMAENEPPVEVDPVLLRKVTSDGGLNRIARVINARERRNADGVYVVQVEVFNTTRKRQQFLYQFEWFDADGLQLQSAARDGWRPVIIEGRDRHLIEGVAPRLDVADFRLKLQESTN